MQVLDFLKSNEDINKLFSVYKNEFSESFKRIKRSEKKKKLAIKKNSQIIFLKWFYSTLIDNTYFSPANIFNRIIYENFGDEIAVVPNVVPIFIENEIRDFKIEYRVFTLDNNSIFDDIRSLQRFFLGKKFELKKMDFKTIFENVQDNIFVKDEYYLFQLFNIASYFSAFSYEDIGKKVFLTGNDFDVNFFNDSKSYLKIIDFWLPIAAQLFENFFGNMNPYTVSCLKRYIKNKTMLQKLLDKTLAALNINKDEFVNYALGIDNDESKTYYENYFIVSAYLVKYFVIPLSYFIPIIQPCYISKVNFDFIFNDAEIILKEGYSSYDLLNDPFLIYDLSHFGNKLMKRSDRSRLQDVFDTPVNIDEILMTKNEIYSNPEMQDFWQNIDPKELEELIKLLDEKTEEMVVEEKPKRKLHKEGNVIHLFNNKK
jgi:hypothetical protein